MTPTTFGMPLSPRQREVYEASRKGEPRRQTAARLGLTPKSVKAILHVARKRLGIDARDRCASRLPPDIPPELAEDYKFLRRNHLTRVEIREALRIPMVATIAIVEEAGN